MTDVTVLAARRAMTPDPYLVLGEGPFWDEAARLVRWVDVQAGVVFEGDLSDDVVTQTRSTNYGETVGAAIPAADGGLVVAGSRALRIIGPDGCESRAVRLIPHDVDSRLNDAACDPAGRLLVGSLALDGRTGQERLFGLDAEGGVSIVLEGLTLSNGIGFSPDGSTMYLVDSIPGVIWAFDYDVATGTVGARREVGEQGDDVPDGLAVDVEGHLWVAYFGAGQVRRLSPEGDVLARVEVAAPNTTCPAFVGSGRDRLLITTAREQLTAEQLARWPDSGSLFIADVGVAGLPTPGWAGGTVRQTVATGPESTTDGNPT